MVSILPGQNKWQLLGEAIGKPLQQTLPGAVQQGFQRGQGLSAIDQLQSALKEAGNDPSKILPAIAKAYTLNPNLERSGIAEHYLNKARGTVATKPVLDFTAGGPQNAQAGQQGPQNQPPQNIRAGAQNPPQEKPREKSPEGIFIGNYLPLDVGQLISPEQTAKILNDVVEAGGDVNLARQNIKDFNEGKISINELQNSNVDKKAANVQRMLNFEDQIKKRIGENLPADTPEAEKNIYYNMIRPVLEESKTTSFADAWQKVSADIDNFRKMNEAFAKNIPEADSFMGMSEEQSRTQRQSAQPMLKMDPLAYNIIEQQYQDKGHSPITVAKTFKPLPENVSKTIKSAGDYKDLIYAMIPSSNEFPEAVMQRNLDKATEGMQKDVEKLTPQLRKEWNEDISLLNMYADLKSKGWGDQYITTLFDDLSDLFGSRQKAERTMVNQPLRVPARYLDWPL